MNMKVFLWLFSSCILLSFRAYPQALWEIDKDKDGIIVYTRLEGNSEFKSFKAITRVDASQVEIIKLLKDAGNYKKWYGYTRTSMLLKEEKDVQYNYVETIFPWPYSNRDMVYRMSIDTSNPSEPKLFLKGLPDYIPEKKGIVRMKKAEGYIELRSVDNQTEVTYVFHSEPNKNIPAWLANKSIAELPFKTLQGLREILEE